MNQYLLKFIFILVVLLLLGSTVTYTYVEFVLLPKERALKEEAKLRYDTMRLTLRSMNHKLQQTQPLGYKLYHDHACDGCHSIMDDTLNVGPSLRGIVQAKSKKYLKDALENPNKTVLHGFEKDIMPTFNLTDEEFEALCEYMAAFK